MPPVNLLIKPASSLCNMRCKYCFYTDVSANRDIPSYGIMSIDTLETVVSRAFEYASGFAGFAFQGGEPTLAGIDFYKDLIELQKKYNKNKIKVHNSIQTNGYQINEEWARFFAENDFLVGLSLDGTQETHDYLRIDTAGRGTYSRVVQAAEILSANHVEFNILSVVNNFVARYPGKVYEQLKKYKYIQFIACIDRFDEEKNKFSLTEERYTNFLKQTFELYYRDFMNGHYVSVRNFDNYINILLGRQPENCAMNGFCTCYCVVEGNGNVYPCDFYVLDEWCLGNIKDNSLPEILTSAKAVEFTRSSRFIDPKCKTCRYYALCRGGCRRDREPFSDGYPVLNKHCQSYKALFDRCYFKMMEIASSIKNS